MLTAPVILPGRPKGKKVKPPRLPRSLEEELRQIEPLRAHVSRENFAEMIATVKERWKTGKRHASANPK